jgi:hypothetical protein
LADVLHYAIAVDLALGAKAWVERDNHLNTIQVAEDLIVMALKPS